MTTAPRPMHARVTGRLTGAGRALAVALGGAMGGLGLWALRSFDPNAAGNPFLPCLFHALTGWYCPGCGSTRALHALAHGDLGGMLAMNPLLALAAPGVAVVALHGSGARLPLPAWLLDALLSARFWLGLILGFWLLRNLPWWPFSWLAPG